ncbi:MAG: SAM-dependent methyltransferase [Candidatus Dadabacteria bacterium]|nr:SAM-dependent methyltransferase [Candidatus Dadabacteria bacterium]
MNNLEEIITSQIRDSGPITFAEFMELALYHPVYGYYSSGISRIGKEGDFYTSPHVHSAFGKVLGNFIVKSFDVIREEKLTIIELGAGQGLLALDIFNHIKSNNPEYYDQSNYYIVEQSDRFQNESKKTLIDHRHKIKWFSSLDELENEKVTGVIISNELIDAFPFHRAKLIGGNLSEIYVSVEDDEITEVTGKPSSTELEEYFVHYDIHFKEGQEFEINLHAEKLLQKIDNILRKGFILTIDYGYLAPQLFSPERMKGTYKCIYKHAINETPYINIGEQDITAHVDFSNLIRAGESLKINKVQYTTQGQFLLDWGILDLISADIKKKSSPDSSFKKDIQAIKNLFLPELMGDRFKILLQKKNLEINHKNFYPESPFKISFNVL